ncbi:coiled-coil domain-containing protein 71 [Xenopus laevis]|uniref:Coiled-coil domain-containing protein 71 n=2 Tax=Xenopus laevis TaxID=8355 RepID=A0A1L8GPT8_XENLA|nr:coiled-coil domain-containing protein 71 [Xenopus laevis]XP_018114599.1 coiled-coil domain-containing protein 71 [Xenopus laevis]XP_018114600.1 coiled-coil domain-containing protein 71 [Xenopus laevis]XP_018114601.1 coiled-coil domain-containing protein 71 [Xenopus laevis]XP_018114602.1 coiled-coil domain-containing protein 71 [Xenopus laevis]XP_041446796.1 coiled-coil domain-containing protein 71 [Xenopus laevis]OCT85877.1 hypothetical protein XELAEV_18024046mg [Xenopus laevis]
MNLEVAHMEEKAVHSWSRISSAGKRAFEEALRVFNPVSKDLTDTETQLVTFLQGLREEGFQPTILSSKDVYGYNSTTADAPPSVSKCPPKNASKAQSKSTSKTSSTPVNISVHSSKVTKDSSESSTNLLLQSLNQEKTDNSNVSSTTNMHPGVYPAMRLSVVLETLVPLNETASSLESKFNQHSIVVASKGMVSKCTSEMVDAKAYQCLLKNATDLENHIGPLNGKPLKGPNGKVLKENNASKASGILNGQNVISSSKNFNCLVQTKHNSKVQKDLFGKAQPLGGQNLHSATCKKRKLANDIQDHHSSKINDSASLDKQATFSKEKLDSLRSKVIKVDRSFSDDELRRRAQNILQVDLSPVIRIHPLSLTIS